MTNQDGTQPSYDPTQTNTSSQHAATEDSTPQQIGSYKIIRTIGEGGMGTVYEAEQENPKRTVALKVIRAGLASAGLLKRFELESQVLGRLQHPGIGQIYQAGTADTESGKRPYFAMEYVRGVDLRQHVNQKNLNTRERLDLLAKICDAVHHAHQKGVIHRDLKPGNILVDQSGQPKILDFGVARATDSDMQVTTMQTDVGQLIGTLQYMSPEQVAADPNDLDTRSDVYALGVIAYEMLTGQVPYNLKNKMIHEAARIIREDEPTALSATSRVFRGDIETIVVKAMEKEKERRYQSAAGLAEDVRRYLKDQPILARPQSAIYQLQKFAKRNKALAGGVVVAMSALVIGMTTSTYLYIQADSARQGEAEQRILAQEREAETVVERDNAKREAETAKQVQKFMIDLFKISNPSEAKGNTITAREIMDKAAERIDQELAGQPKIQAPLLRTISNVYRSLGLYDQALPLAQHALRLSKEVNGNEHPDVADSLNDLATVLQDQGKNTEAEKLLRQALDMRRKLLGDEHPDVARQCC